MLRLFNDPTRLLRQLPRAMLAILVVAGPVMAVPAIRGPGSGIIEAPAIRNTGAGFVLLVSLQRG